MISVTDSAGALLGLNRYDEFGQPQATNIGAFGYTGQAWLPGASLWHYKARAFEPELGRFLQPDPIGVEGGVNLYAYVGNDPVNLVDPLGFAPVVVTGRRGCSGDMFSTCIDADAVWRPPEPSFGRERDPRVACRGRHGPDCEEIVITRRRKPGSTPFFFNGVRYALDPDYQKPWWSDAFDAAVGCVAVCPIGIAGAIVAVPEAGAAVAGRMATSRVFGFTSTRFANTRYGGPGTWNTGPRRIGWSFNSKTGQMNFQPRIGNWHVPTPFKTDPF